MKKLWVAIGLLLMTGSAWAKGIEFFHGSWEQALAKAKKEKKLLFVDMYADWCGPCKKMAKEVFTLDDVGAYYNTRFINYKLDVEDEDLDGPELQEAYKVKNLPTFLYLDGSGEVQHRGGGRMDPGAFIQMGKLASGEGMTFAELSRRYQAGDRSSALISEYLDMVPLHLRTLSSFREQSAIKKAAADIAEGYLSGFSDKQLVTERAFSLIDTYLNGATRGKSVIEFVIDNHDKYSKLFTNRKVAGFICRVNQNTIEKLAKVGDGAFKKYLKDIRGELAPFYTEVYGSVDGVYKRSSTTATSAYALATADWDTYLDLHEDLVKRAGANPDVYMLNEISVDLIDAGCEDPKALKRALKFSRMAYERYTNKSLMTAPTYTRLLIRLGHYGRAEKVLEEAIVQCGGPSDSARDTVKGQLKMILAALHVL